uniref:Uncharacterized protein n=1 Tax=Onchocerca volvulus TaxID=6282 RepID=A0A8R1TK76_ONCVO
MDEKYLEKFVYLSMNCWNFQSDSKRDGSNASIYILCTKHFKTDLKLSSFTKMSNNDVFYIQFIYNAFDVDI